MRHECWVWQPPRFGGGVTLDAMVMDGQSFDVGAVAFLSKYRSAARVARLVMEHTSHSLLVGEGAQAFAHMMGVPQQSTVTNSSMEEYHEWVDNNCQPNFYTHLEGSGTSCPPYPPPDPHPPLPSSSQWASSDNHDTIGVISVDGNRDMACGTTTNGANHKVRGRVGDSPIVGSFASSSPLLSVNIIVLC